MVTAIRQRRPRTLAEALRRLGNVPTHRILWTPYPGTATEADALTRRRGPTGQLVELVDGTLVEKAMGARESFMAASFIGLLYPIVSSGNRGLLGSSDLLCRVLQNQLRYSDASFTSWERLPAPDAHLQSIADFTPDLCIEVLSDSNTRREMARKRRDYFRGGARLVWEVDPVGCTVTVYEQPKNGRVLTTADILDGGEVLPGFSLNLGEFFDLPQHKMKS